MDDSLSKINSTVYSNISANITYMIPLEFQFAFLSMYGITCFIVLFGNGIVCYTSFKIHSFRTVTNFFILSLAITDIIMTITCVPFSILSNLFFHYWPFWDFMCPLVAYIQLVSVLMRAFTLVAMTCDRYHVARKPLKPRILTKFRAKVLIVLMCALSSIIALPTVINSKIVYMPYEPGSQGLCVELWDDQTQRSIYGVTLMMIQYFVPLLIMIVTYAHIGVIIWVKQTPGEANTARDERLAMSKKKTIKMIIVVVVAYLLSWLPLHVITIVGDVNPTIFDSDSIHMVWIAAHWLAFSNSGVNPVIYYWMNSKFRQNFLFCMHMVCCFRKRRSERVLYQDSFRLASYQKSIKGVKPDHEMTMTTDHNSAHSSSADNLQKTGFAGRGVKDECIKRDNL